MRFLSLSTRRRYAAASALAILAIALSGCIVIQDDDDDDRAPSGGTTGAPIAPAPGGNTNGNGDDDDDDDDDGPTRQITFADGATLDAATTIAWVDELAGEGDHTPVNTGTPLTYVHDESQCQITAALSSAVDGTDDAAATDQALAGTLAPLLSMDANTALSTVTSTGAAAWIELAPDDDNRAEAKQVAASNTGATASAAVIARSFSAIGQTASIVVTCGSGDVGLARNVLDDVTDDLSLRVTP